MFPQVNLKGAAPAVITHRRTLCFAPAVKSVFELTQTQCIVTVILSTLTRGAHLRGSDTVRKMFYLVCTNGPGAGREAGGACGRKHTEIGGGGWDREFYKLTRMLLFGQVEPADLLTFHQLVFLHFNGHTIINQMSGLDRHARAGFKTFCLDRCLVRCVAV